jgi:aminoglycoside 3-N-acetyltransferase
MLQCKSNILYMRASLKPLVSKIKSAGGILNFLHEHIEFNEIFVPYFFGARPFWRGREKNALRKTNSGALGRLISNYPNSETSKHPTHSFTGLGERVVLELRKHNGSVSCFHPIKIMAEKYDFSMLLLGCLKESPGFSTVHVAQHQLGLSKRHLLRYILRWDETCCDKVKSYIAPESPGCSKSFDKFYPYYQADNNLVYGEWYGISWIFVPSAFKAINTELSLLRSHGGRFVDCGRLTCLPCRLRLY